MITQCRLDLSSLQPPAFSLRPPASRLPLSEPERAADFTGTGQARANRIHGPLPGGDHAVLDGEAFELTGFAAREDGATQCALVGHEQFGQHKAPYESGVVTGIAADRLPCAGQRQAEQLIGIVDGAAHEHNCRTSRWFKMASVPLRSR